jgi:hypothetical protein
MNTGRVLSGIGPFNTVTLRAIEITDPVVSPVISVGTIKEVRIAEVWLVPDNEPAISKQFLEKATLNTVKELLEFCRGKSDDRGFPLTLRYKLLAKYFQNLQFEDTNWHMAVRTTDDGDVISVIFGHHTLMAKARELGFIPQ